MKKILILLSFLAFAVACKDDPKPEPAPPPPVVEPPPPPIEDQYSSRVISRFLWKPEGEHTGKIVVLTDPEGVETVIESSKGREKLDDPYPTNGYGSTNRGNNPGCWYGKDIKVYFYDKQQAMKPIKTKMGAEYKGVADGCKRYSQDSSAKQLPYNFKDEG